MRHDSKPPERRGGAERAIALVRQQTEARVKAELDSKKYDHCCLVIIVCTMSAMMSDGHLCRRLVEKYNKEIRDRTHAIEREEMDRMRTEREKQAAQNRVW